MTDLKSTLKQYSDWQVPFPASNPRSLSVKERKANFAAMMAEKPRRLEVMRSALPHLHTAIDTLLNSAADPVAGIRGLEDWWLNSLSRINLIPPVASPLRKLLRPGGYFAKNEAMATAHWDERHDHPLVPKLASMMDDLGLLLGEAVVLRRPDFNWELNHYQSEKRADTMDYGRPCILRPKLGDFPLKAFAMPFLARSNYGMLHLYKRTGGLRPATEMDGVWYGTFLGWTVVDILDGGFTEDHYPDGPAGERVAGRRQR